MLCPAWAGIVRPLKVNAKDCGDADELCGASEDTSLMSILKLMRSRFGFQPSGGDNGIRADVALGDQPTAATRAMIPAFMLDLGQVGGAAHDLTAVAEFGAVARSAVGTGQQEGHVDFPWQCRVTGGLGNRYAMWNQFSTCWRSPLDQTDDEQRREHEQCHQEGDAHGDADGEIG